MIDLEKVALLDSATDALDPVGPATAGRWRQYRELLTRPKTKAADTERLAELCGELRIDRETLRLHAAALATEAELAAVVARRDEVNAERDAAFAAERELDDRIRTTLKALEGEREAIRTRKQKAFSAAESVLLAEKQRGAITGVFAALFGRARDSVNLTAASGALPAALKNAVAEIERRAGKRGAR